MSIANSPLRYPGGKAVLSEFLAEVLRANCLRNGVYAEPYAGGAGAALNLLFAEHVQRIILNDADPCIFAFWHAILHQKDDFIARLEETPINIDEWKRQREIYRNQALYSQIEVAFSGFYLNRCNRSGIMVNGGPIGGHGQEGEWKLDARFNKVQLKHRIEKIHLYRDRIDIYNLDAIDFLGWIEGSEISLDKTLVYLDPPYYVKGGRLYLNHYQPEDHANLATFITRLKNYKWIMTYDNVPEIQKLYSGQNQIGFYLRYSAQAKKIGSELLIYGEDTLLPDDTSMLGGAIR